MKRLGLALFVLALAALACGSGPEAPSPTPSAGPLVQATDTPLQPATATPSVVSVTAAPTSTPTALPAPTSTLRPTATPQGYYEHKTAGFALTVPSSWQVDSEDPSGVVFVDSSGGLALLIYRDTDPAALDLDEQVDDLIESLTSEDVPAKRQEDEGELALADGLVVRSVDVIRDPDTADEVLMRMALVVDGARRHLLVLYILPDLLDSREQTLARVFGSLRFINTLYGLDRRETLVVLGFDPEPKDLDPARATGSADGYVGMLYAGLVRLSPELQIVPDLAESWAVSPDGATYTFTLREGLTFASGRPLTAADVVYSWERAADPETDSSTARTYLGDILGVDEMLDGDADHIAGVEAVDDRTLVVSLDAPKAYFLAKLTYPTAYVVDEQNVAASANRWMFNPNPSGPYNLRDYSEDEVVIFERNERFHALAGVPYVVNLLQIGGTPLSLYEIGELDVVGLQPAEAAEVSQPASPLHAEWQTTTSMCTTLLQLDVSKPPLDDPDVRLALVLALDRASLNQQFTEGGALLADSVLPPAMPGFSPDLPRFAFDAEAAQAALAGSTYAGGDLPPLIINQSGLGQTPSDYISAVAGMWRDALGLEIEIRQLDPEDYSRAAREQHGHVVSYGWCADYPDPENFLDILYHSDSEFNVAGFANPEVDALLEAARSEPDVSVRLDLYRQAETIIVGEVGVIPISHSVQHILVKPYVKGYVLVPIGALVIPSVTLEYED